MKEYTYPDRNDKTTIVMIGQKNPYERYWEKSEGYVLSFVDEKIKKKSAKMLDVGGGEGRLSERFAKKFQKIDFIEPDKERLSNAKRNLKERGIRNVNFYNKEFLNASLQENSYEFILISHVLQHVKTDEVKLQIKKARSLLKNDGLLVILTSHSRKKSDLYLASYLDKQGKFKEFLIPKEKFNSLINNSKGILPIRLFSIRSLIAMLSGFKIDKIKVFHELHKKTVLDKIIFRDKWVNLPFMKEMFGRDICIIARKVHQKPPTLRPIEKN